MVKLLRKKTQAYIFMTLDYDTKVQSKQRKQVRKLSFIKIKTCVPRAISRT